MTDEPRPLNLFAMDGYDAYLLVNWGGQTMFEAENGNGSWSEADDDLLARLRVFWERHGAPDAPE